MTDFLVELEDSSRKATLATPRAPLVLRRAAFNSLPELDFKLSGSKAKQGNASVGDISTFQAHCPSSWNLKNFWDLVKPIFELRGINS